MGGCRSVEAPRAESEQAPKGRASCDDHRRPKISAGGLPAAGADFGKIVFLGLFSIHQSIKIALFSRTNKVEIYIQFVK